jgi:hypothetical protein
MAELVAVDAIAIADYAFRRWALQRGETHSQALPATLEECQRASGIAIRHFHTGQFTADLLVRRL